MSWKTIAKVSINLELIRNKGLDRITVPDLVEELKPRARATVPAKAKEELLARIKNFIENNP